MDVTPEDKVNNRERGHNHKAKKKKSAVSQDPYQTKKIILIVAVWRKVYVANLIGDSEFEVSLKFGSAILISFGDKFSPSHVLWYRKKEAYEFTMREATNLGLNSMDKRR